MKIFKMILEFIKYPYYKMEEFKERRKVRKEMEEKRKKSRYFYK